jgi:predicted Holliday junction resolvase-like endonuclease
MGIWWGITITFGIILLILAIVIDRFNSTKLSNLKNEIALLKEKNSKVLSQKKSSEVRLGKIGENMAPFFSEWPYDPNGFRFLGNPVDGIQFNEDEIVFVEIKTGKARLTTSQKKAKQLIKEGKVRFATFRVDEGGCSLKVEEIIDYVDNNDTLIKVTK